MYLIILIVIHMNYDYFDEILNMKFDNYDSY